VKKIIDLFQNPVFLRHFHGWATCVWICLLIPSLLFWSESVMWVVLMSVWANIAGHWSAWQASRSEIKAEENGKT
jgi:hypothetical protein